MLLEVGPLLGLELGHLRVGPRLNGLDILRQVALGVGEEPRELRRRRVRRVGR